MVRVPTRPGQPSNPKYLMFCHRIACVKAPVGDGGAWEPWPCVLWGTCTDAPSPAELEFASKNGFPVSPPRPRLPWQRAHIRRLSNCSVDLRYRIGAVDCCRYFLFRFRLFSLKKVVQNIPCLSRKTRSTFLPGFASRIQLMWAKWRMSFLFSCSSKSDLPFSAERLSSLHGVVLFFCHFAWFRQVFFL